MSNQELIDALTEIEQFLELQPPIGAAELPPEIRYFRVLRIIRDHVCPAVSAIVDFSKKSEGEIVTILVDILITFMSSLPVPVATVSKHIAALGVDRFCSDPSSLLTK